MTGWEPLAAADPIPGDPDVSATAGTYYTGIAESMAEAYIDLKVIQDMDGFESDAVEALRDKAEDVRGEVRKAQDRYEAAGAALTAYTVEHREAQEAAADLLARARETQERVWADERALVGARDQHDEAVMVARYSGEPVDGAVQAGVSSAESTLSMSQAVLDGHVRQLPDIVSTWRSAAQKANDAISEVVASDGLNDGWWEEWGSKVAHVVSDWAGKIATWAGVASLLLGWVPILGQALVLITLVATVAAFVADFALALHDEGGWGDVALGALGIVTFGVGSRIGRAGKALASKGMAQGARRGGRLAARSSNFGSPRNGTAAREVWSNATRGFREVPVTWRNPMSWFRSGIASFSGSSGRAAFMNFLGHGEAARTYQALRNADEIPVFARRATGYVETMGKLGSPKSWPVESAGSFGSALVPYTLSSAGVTSSIAKGAMDK